MMAEGVGSEPKGLIPAHGEGLTGGPRLGVPNVEVQAPR